jgi:glycosyltransferase involved in cell wall biosynthesis
MISLGPRKTFSAAIFAPAALYVWDDAFYSIAASRSLNLETPSPKELEADPIRIAAFLFGLFRTNSYLRRRFPRALSEGERGDFGQWLQRTGGRQLKLSDLARGRFRMVLQQRPGRRVRNIYLNDPDLQSIYPLGLVPVGQFHFLEWLTTHGRVDHGVSDGEILWFLQESAEDPLNGLCLTFLLQPAWQEHFPLALTRRGWREFRQWIDANYGEYLRRPLPATVPPVLSEEDQICLETACTGAQLDGVNILSHFCNPSGIQQAAVWTKTALERVGLRTSCRDVPVPRRIVPDNREQWLGLEIFPVTILTQAATPYFKSGYERSGLLRRDNIYRIAYWAWELETVPDEWVEAAELVDEIWSPTRFVVEAMRARMPCPVHYMLPGVEVGPIEQVTRASLNIPENHFVFLFMFDLHSQLHRKNPVGVFDAFRQAFGENDKATLVIKTSGGDIHSADLEVLRKTIRGPNVILLDELMTRARAYGLIAMSDCFVSLHRSEGFGLGLAEAMLMAKPVIATDYSGNLDFMNRNNSLLVDYERVEIKEDRPIYTRGNFWAEPSIDQAATYMRQVYEDRDSAHARALRGQAEVQSLLSLETAGKRMRARLEQIVAG